MLNTDFLGLEMKNPIIVAAGPWNKDGQSIKNFLKAGAGAVVTESIISDLRMDVSPRIAYDGAGAQNIRLYSDIPVENWEWEMDIAKSAGGVVIASISGHTPSELAYLAAKMERFGADAIELSVSNPMGESLEVLASHPQPLYDITREIVSNVKIPVIVKLSQNATNISQVAKAVKKAGASGVSAINTVRCILEVDIENAIPTLCAYGGYSGPPIRPLALASVATIAQSVDIPICGIGGIENHINAVEYFMLGASAVQIGTAVMLDGEKQITKTVQDLEEWAEKEGISSVGEICGKALENLKAIDEMMVEPATSKVIDTPCLAECCKCVTACMYGAIEKLDEEININPQLCTGCGLCSYLCPVRKFKLDW